MLYEVITQQQRIRDMAFDALRAYRDMPFEPPVPTAERIDEMVMFLTGRELSADYVAFLEQELSLKGEDPYAQPKIFQVPSYNFV